MQVWHPTAIVARCLAVLAFSVVIASSNAAHATLSFCNETGTKVFIAIAVGQKDPPGVSTGGDLGVAVEGWKVFAHGECSKVSDADAAGSWVYFYAEGPNQDRTWQGSARLCVPKKAFKNDQSFLHGKDSCKPGFRSVGFVRIDADKKNWTEHLKP
jgi:uncharacterized membrane protein